MKLITAMLTAMLIGGALSTAPAYAAPTTDDAARTALAHQIVAAAWPDLANGQLEVTAAEGMVKLDRGFYSWAGDGAADAPGNPPVPPASLDDARLHAGLEVGAARIAPRLELALSGVYGDNFTASELSGILAFYRSPAGLAKGARFRRTAVQMAALQLKQVSDPPDGGPIDRKAKADIAALTAAGNKETPGELAFDATPAGRALKTKSGVVEAETRAAINGLWPEATDAAEADYCAKSPCAAPEHAFFAYLGGIFAAPASH